MLGYAGEGQGMDYEDEITVGDVAGAVVELSRQNEILAARMGVSLELADEGGYGDAMRAALGEPVGFTSPSYDDEVGFAAAADELTSAELSGGVEEELSLALGASSMAEYEAGQSEADIEDRKYGEIVRLTGQQYDDELRSAGHRFIPPTWTELQAAAPQPVGSEDYLGLGRQYDFGLPSTVREEVHDGVSERAEALGLSADSDVDRIVALASAAQRGANPALAAARDQREQARYIAAANGVSPRSARGTTPCSAWQAEADW
jgi:hypothetical protein